MTRANGRVRKGCGTSACEGTSWCAVGVGLISLRLRHPFCSAPFRRQGLRSRPFADGPLPVLWVGLIQNGWSSFDEDGHRRKQLVEHVPRVGIGTQLALGVGWSRAVAAFGLPSREARGGFGPRASCPPASFRDPTKSGPILLTQTVSRAGRVARKRRRVPGKHTVLPKRIYMAMHASGQSLRGACSQRMPFGMSIEATAAFLWKKTTQRSQEFSSGKSGKKRSARRFSGARPRPCAGASPVPPARSTRPSALGARNASRALVRSRYHAVRHGLRVRG